MLNASASVMKAEILKKLSVGKPFSTVELADTLGFKRNSTAAVMWELFRNKWVKRTGEGNAGKPYIYELVKTGEKVPAIPVRPKRKSRSKSKTQVEALLTIQIGNKETLTITIAEAKDLYDQLARLSAFFKG